MFFYKSHSFSSPTDKHFLSFKIWSVRYHPTRDQLLLSAGSDSCVCLYGLPSVVPETKEVKKTATATKSVSNSSSSAESDISVDMYVLIITFIQVVMISSDTYHFTFASYGPITSCDLWRTPPRSYSSSDWRMES